MIQDINVTATKAVADAYTELNTAAEIYDRTKSYLYDNWAGEASLLTLREGQQVNIGSTNVISDATASTALSVGTDITIKSSTLTSGFKGAGSVTVQNGVVIDGGVFNSNVIYNQGPSTIYNATIDNLEITQAGTYFLESTDVGTVTNTSGGNVTLQLDANSSITTNSGPNITVNAPSSIINLTDIEAGSQVVIYQAGTTTELFRTTTRLQVLRLT